MWRRGEDLEAFAQRVHDASISPHEHATFALHQMGSCRMGNDPATSVADPWGELHDVKGVWIGDASAFPDGERHEPDAHDDGPGAPHRRGDRGRQIT